MNFSLGIQTKVQANQFKKPHVENQNFVMSGGSVDNSQWSKFHFSLDALPEIRILNWLYYWNFLLCMLHAKLQTIFSEFFRLVLNPSLLGDFHWQPISLVEFWIVTFLAFTFSQEGMVLLGLLLQPLKYFECLCKALKKNCRIMFRLVVTHFLVSADFTCWNLNSFVC